MRLSGGAAYAPTFVSSQYNRAVLKYDVGEESWALFTPAVGQTVPRIFKLTCDVPPDSNLK